MRRVVPISLLLVVVSVIGVKAYFDVTDSADKKSNACKDGPSVDRLKEILSSETPAIEVKAEFCDKTWQIIWVKGGENEQVASTNRILLHFEGGQWKAVDEGDLSTSQYCAFRAGLPKKVKDAMKCAW